MLWWSREEKCSPLHKTQWKRTETEESFVLQCFFFPFLVVPNWPPDPCISKVAEEFVVDGFVKSAVMILNDNQYGAIPNSSTSVALIIMLHSWSLGTDGNGATVRTLLLDYRKAFDLIDHSILVRKLRNQCKLPASIINWIIDFLSDRSQRIKFASECFSEWGPVPVGVPQGTKLGPWRFTSMLKNLNLLVILVWTRAQNKLKVGVFMQKRINVDAAKISAAH